ncbi:MAG: PRC-barrel domain-containing protein [Candidatus Bathyarchaeia archaeon]
MQTNIFATLIGRSLKDDSGREIGKIVSFVIDSSGEVREVLVENKGEEIIKYPVERLKAGQDDVLLVSEIDRRVEEICEKLPVLLKKREILESLFRNKEILPEIYESLSAEFDKSIDDMRVKVQGVLGDIERQIQSQENIIRMLHLARTFLEMEHGIGNVRDDVFRQSLLSILREIKYASYRKMSLLKTKEKVSGLSVRADVSVAADKYVDQKPVVNVRITNE